jgi:adhesin transport system outer membrane protein
VSATISMATTATPTITRCASSPAGISIAAASIAREQEQIRRAGEQRYALAQVQREVEGIRRSAWNERASRGDLSGILGKQAVDQQPARRLLSRAVQGRAAFAARRSRCPEHPFNTKVLADTARVASLFAEYKILAASGNLLQTMKLKPVEQAKEYARQDFAVPAAFRIPAMSS